MTQPDDARAGAHDDVLVVGGGIAGLAAAWYAAAAGRRVTVLEAAPRIGGKLRVDSVAGVPLDTGAEAMLTARPEGVALLDDLGVADQRIGPLTTSAGIRAGGRTHPLPARTMMGIPSDVEAARSCGALTPTGLAMLAGEPDLPPLPPLTEDVSVGSLVRQRVGDEVADRLVDPLLGGVYAGRADALSLRATVPRLGDALAGGGSLLAAVRSVVGAGTRPSTGSIFTSLRGGLGRLPHLLADAGRFEVRTATTVCAIRRTTFGFAVEVGAVSDRQHLTADTVIIAVPPAKAARLLRDLAPYAAAELAAIDSASSAVVSFAFAGVAPLPPGSGLLVATGERLATKGLTLSSQKWPLDTDSTMLRASVGRLGEPAALQFDDADLIELVRRELRPLIGVDAQPVDARVTRWGGGLPQYAVGHVERVARIRAAVAQVPGLAVCGAAFDGVGIPACIGSACTAVAGVAVPARG